jgi:hypothetical protein
VILPVALAIGLAAAPSEYEATARAVERGNAALRKRAWTEAIMAYDEADRASADLEERTRTSVRWAIAENRARAALGLAREEGRTGPLQAVAAELAALDLDGAPAPTKDRIEAVRREVEAELERAAAPSRAGKLEPLTIAGIVVCASAAIGVAVMVAGLVVGARAEDDYAQGPTRAARTDADKLGARGNSMAFGGGLSAGLLLGAGASLLVLGRNVDVRGKAGATARVSATGVTVRF